jgi:hypothetical protein
MERSRDRMSETKEQARARLIAECEAAGDVYGETFSIHDGPDGLAIRYLPAAEPNTAREGAARKAPRLATGKRRPCHPHPVADRRELFKQEQDRQFRRLAPSAAAEQEAAHPHPAAVRAAERVGSRVYPHPSSGISCRGVNELAEIIHAEYRPVMERMAGALSDVVGALHLSAKDGRQGKRAEMRAIADKARAALRDAGLDT